MRSAHLIFFLVAYLMPGDVTVVAYEASTGALAVGTSRGALKVIGGGGVELLLHDAAQPMQGMQLITTTKSFFSTLYFFY